MWTGTDRQTDSTHACTAHILTYSQPDTQTYIQTDRQTDRQTTGRQQTDSTYSDTDRPTETERQREATSLAAG